MKMWEATAASNTSAPRQFLATGKEKYAYRRFGERPGLPLLFLQHCTGTLDNGDPVVTDPLATGREVILFESAGLGRSSEKAPETVAGMAAQALAFLDGLGLKTCDVLGFSLGGMAAAQIAAFRDWEKFTGQRLVDLKDIRQTVLVVEGVHDEMIPVRNSYWLSENLPNAVLMTYRDSGQGSLFQFHDAFNGQAAAFLASDFPHAPYSIELEETKDASDED